MISRCFACLLTCMTLSGSSLAGEGTLTLWYDKPAQRWEEALPVGNGRLGAMVFGGIGAERIQLNEETVWAGPPVPQPHDGIRQAMTESREAWFAGDFATAHKVLQAALPPRISPRSYQTLGDLHLKLDGAEKPENYHRQLDLDTAIATTRFSIDGVGHVREVFCTAVDQVLVVRHSADEPGALNMEVLLDRPVDFETKPLGNDGLGMTGQAQHGGKHLGVKWHARLVATTSPGKMAVWPRPSFAARRAGTQSCGTATGRRKSPWSPARKRSLPMTCRSARPRQRLAAPDRRGDH